MAGLSVIHGPPLSEQPGLGATTIPGFLREVTQRFADREALVHRTTSGVVRWTYAELWARSVEVARALIACGVGKDTRVGVLMTNRPEFLAAMFGTALAGGVTVALNTFSTPTELAHLLSASGVQTLLVERNVAGKDFGDMLVELEPVIAEAKPGALHSAKFPFLRRLAVLDPNGARGAIESWDAFLAHGERTPTELVDARSRTTTPADAAVLFFSSGTTSLPKGIFHAHRAVSVQWWRMPAMFSTGDDVRVWTANGFFWSGNFAMVIGNALASGGSIVLQSIFEPEEALKLMESERVSYPIASPHQWSRLEGAPNWRSVNLSSLRHVDYRYPNRDQGTIQSDWRMPLAYGATETLAINCATNGLSGDLPADCYGRPLWGMTLKVIDPFSGKVVPLGERGEFAIKGVTLMMNYLGKTPEDSFDNEGYYRTGDGGYVDEQGRMFFEGRLSDIIKTGGANVSPIEIDLAIRAHPDVKVTQTIGVPDKLLGEMVVSCIVLHPGVAYDETALRVHLKERLASFKIPRQILVMTEDEIGMTGSNKVKSSELRERVRKRLAHS